MVLRVFADEGELVDRMRRLPQIRPTFAGNSQASCAAPRLPFSQREVRDVWPRFSEGKRSRVKRVVQFRHAEGGVGHSNVHRGRTGTKVSTSPRETSKGSMVPQTASINACAEVSSPCRRPRRQQIRWAPDAGERDGVPAGILDESPDWTSNVGDQAIPRARVRQKLYAPRVMHRRTNGGLMSKSLF